MANRNSIEQGKPSVNEVISARKLLIRQVSGDTSTLGLAKNVIKARALVYDNDLVDAALASTIRAGYPKNEDQPGGKAA